MASRKVLSQEHDGSSVEFDSDLNADSVLGNQNAVVMSKKKSGIKNTLINVLSGDSSALQLPFTQSIDSLGPESRRSPRVNPINSLEIKIANKYSTLEKEYGRAIVSKAIPGDPRLY